MPASSTDRLNGLTTSVAVKPPCRAATTANITLSGLQTIDGVALATGDRVLVKNQTNAVNNGIWEANTSAWSRATDFDGALDAVSGTIVIVIDASDVAQFWRLTTANPVVIGTSALTFERVITGTAETIQYDDPIAPTYLKTVSDIINGLPVSVHRFIDTTKLSGIRAGTTTYDATDDMQDGVDAVMGANSNGAIASLYVPAGLLLSRKLTTKAGLFHMVGEDENGSMIKLINGANESLFDVHAQCVANFEKLYLNGNKANQSGTSHGVHFLPHTSYVLAGSISRCQVVGFLTNGVLGSAFRNQLYMDHTDVRANGNHGISQAQDAVDWFMTDIEVGSNGQIGIDINGLAQIMNFTSYANGSSGVKFGNRLRHSTLISGQIDHNLGNGLEVAGLAGSEGNLYVAGIRFNDNSRSVTNTYDHIALTDAEGVQIVGCSFLDSQDSPQNSIQPKYCVGIYGTTKNLHFLGCPTQTGSFITDITNDYSKLGAGPHWGQQVFEVPQGSFQSLIARRGGLSIQGGSPSNSATIGSIGFEGQDGKYGETRLGAIMKGRMVGDWNNADTDYAPTELVFGVQEASGTATATAAMYRMHPTNGFMVDSGTWNGRHLVMGDYHFWVDSTGDFRIKNGAPTGDTDGTVVGTQT